jgi:transposase
LQLTINRRQEETDMHITTVGLDLAKNLFHLVGLDAQGREVMKKRLSRAQVLRHFANLPKCLIGMEACAGAHYFARELSGPLGCIMLTPNYKNATRHPV